MWVDKDGRPYVSGGVVIGNKRYWMPTDEQFIEAGYHWYIPPAPQPPDMTAFNAACEQFRTVCAQIAQAADLEGFKGGFDEMVEFQQAPIYATIPGLQLAVAWSAANELCKYAADQVGLGQPEWWYDCWRQVEPELEADPESEVPETFEESIEGEPVDEDTSENIPDDQVDGGSENGEETPAN